MVQQFYLHFETKPSFSELDRFFQKCLTYQPILSSSYFVEVDRNDLNQTVREFVRECFPRYSYVLARVVKKEFEFALESGYVTAGIHSRGHFHPVSVPHPGAD